MAEIIDISILKHGPGVGCGQAIQIDLRPLIKLLSDMIRMPFPKKGSKREIFALAILRAKVVCELFEALSTDDSKLVEHFCNHRCALSPIVTILRGVFLRQNYKSKDSISVFLVSWDNLNLPPILLETTGHLAWEM